MKIDLHPIPVLLCLALAACDSDDDDDLEVTETISQWGIVGLDTEDEVEVFALFGKFTSDLTASRFKQEVLPTPDVCEVKIESSDSDDGDDDLDFEFSVDYDDISAGETIVLTSPGGTYTTLELSDDGDSIVYDNSDGAALAGPAPSGLTVAIPGNTYPSFSNITVPDIQELEVTLPVEDSPVTVGTLFNWNPTNNVNTFIDISSTSVDDTTGNSVTVECIVADDGQFRFPDETQLEMGSDFVGESPDYSRTVYKVDVVGRAALVISNAIDI